MKFCQHCGKEIMNQAVICPHCGCSAPIENNKTALSKDEVNFGFCLLSFLIPLFGYIFWYLKRNETPKNAYANGKVALFSSALYFTFMVLLPISFRIIIEALIDIL